MRFGGTGLRPAVCKELATAMGGDIVVGNREGRKSTSGCTAQVAAQGSAGADQWTCTGSVNGLRVLVVDDHAASRDAVRRDLEGWGCAVEAVESGPAALARLQHAAGSGARFDVVLIDELVPDIDGSLFAERVVEAVELAGTRLVLMAAAAPASEVPRPFSARTGKPVRRSDLCEAVAASSGGRRDGFTHVVDKAADAVAGPGPVHILVAEDNAINVMLISEILSAMGHHFRCVSTGHEAVAEVQRQPYDLVLMDCQMPDMDGYEATRAIRRIEEEHGPLRHIPIIALTAQALEDDRVNCLDAGMDDYLRKPLEMRTLRDTVTRWARPGGQDRVLRAVSGGIDDQA